MNRSSCISLEVSPLYHNHNRFVSQIRQRIQRSIPFGGVAAGGGRSEVKRSRAGSPHGEPRTEPPSEATQPDPPVACALRSDHREKGRFLPMPRMPPFVIRWIIASACWKFFIRRFTSCTVVPLPAAIRFRRLPLRIRAFRRSCAVIESMMATTRFNSPRRGHPLQAPSPSRQDRGSSRGSLPSTPSSSTAAAGRENPRA